MLTPHLEKLIWEGKATYNTFMAGGGMKSILNVAKNRWIIILALDHFPYSPSDQENGQAQWQPRAVTQMTVHSIKSDNHFVIRNNLKPFQINGGAVQLYVGDPVHIDTYLVHEDVVEFIFIMNTQALAGPQLPSPP